MSEARPLPPSALCRRCDPGSFAFGTTADLADVPGIIGQERAEEAVRFAIGIRRYGYNLYALGTSGMGKHGFVRAFLEQRAASETAPSDWAYVHNFADPRRPRALRLPPGRAPLLRQDLQRLVEELRAAIPAVFESEDYRTRKKLLEAQLSVQGERAFGGLEERARARGVAIVKTPAGVGMAPLRDGEVIEPEAFSRLPVADQERMKAEMVAIQQELQDALGVIPREARRHREELRRLDRLVTAAATSNLVDEVRPHWADVPAVLEYLADVEKDVVDNAEDFLPPPEGASAVKALLGGRGEKRPTRRYQVNVLVTQSSPSGAPVVYEDHPTHSNLVGRVEHVAELGNLVTDFTLIQAGALHRANGGYLIVDARRLLLQPLAWDELKRALRSKGIRIESVGQALSLTATASLEPEPIPLEVKVVLLGERNLYYMLSQLDPEFSELFKVAADFEEEIERTAEGEQLYARLLGTFARREGLRPLDRGAVGRAIEHASRRAADAERLQVHAETVADLLREADHLAGEGGQDVVSAGHVQAALDAQVRRASRVRERIQEDIRRGTLLIDTRGEAVGQVNGLVVLQLGGYAFGRPSRITARARLGNGNVVDIEKEVALGGPIHSKGVLILAGFLGQRFASERPLSLAASLVFEQSYSGVEGDSASCGELVALLSALGRGARAPGARHHRLRQPARAGAAHRRGEREDRGVLRRLPGRRPDRRPGRSRPGLEREAPDAARGRGGGGGEGPLPGLADPDGGRGGGAAHRRARGGEGCGRPLSGRVGQPARGRPAGRVRGEGPQLRARRPGPERREGGGGPEAAGTPAPGTAPAGAAGAAPRPRAAGLRWDRPDAAD